MREGWQIKTLGDICHVSRGGSPRPIENYLTDRADGINWIKIADATASSKYIYRTAERIIPEGAKRSRLVKEGDFLLSNSMSFGRPYIMRTTGCIHDGWLVLSDKSGVFDQDYLYYFLSSAEAYRQFDDLAGGSTVRNLNTELVKRVTLPLPSLPEQQRIVAILDEALAGLATASTNVEKNLKNVSELFESYLNSIFGQQNWEMQALGDISENLDSKRVPITKQDRKSGDIPYYGASGAVDSVDNFIFDENLLLVSEDGANLVMRTYPIAFSIAGKSWVNNHAHVLRFPDLASQKFVEYFLNSISLTPYVSGMAQPKLNKTALNSIPIPWPKLDERQSVVTRLEEFGAQTGRWRELYETRISALSELKQSILRKAFSGELTSPQSKPLDEAAE